MAFNPKINDWAQQRVWIVGASTGIGEALALQMDLRGAKVMVSARSADKLKALSAKMTQGVDQALDVTQRESVQAAFDRLLQLWGGVDLIVLMAGTYSEMSVTQFDLQAVRQQIEVNLTGSMNVLDVVLPHLTASKQGHVSIVSSVAGYRGLPNSLAYGPSKAALINLSEALYVELKAFDVGVSVVNPGFVDTPLTRQNTFPMPFLITAEKAAEEMITGYERGEFEIHFPKAFTRTLRTLRILPYSLYFKAVSRIARKTNPPEALNSSK